MTDGVSSGGPHKQRMGAVQPKPQAAEERATAVRRTRMGASAPSTAPEGRADTIAPQRTRMGQQAAAETPTQRTRMEQSPPSEPAREPAITVASSTPKSEPTATEIAPSKVPWRAIGWGISLLILATVLVLAARWLRSLPDVAGFLSEYPGTPTMSEATPVGVPGWMGWQHFFNMFFMVLIIRTGLQVRHEKKAPGHFTAKKNSFFSPKGSTPKKVSLSQWIHQALDVFWVVNGIIFIVLLFATSQWLRIVPTDWDVVPNALSAGLQYASLDWPQENGWVHYNALQMLAYTTTVFVAAPLAFLSGIRFSTWWPDTNATLSKVYPVELARTIHYPVMLYFLAFTLVHVMLVFLTGALRNLNHMYTSRDTEDWIGLAVFLGSLLVIGAAWVLTKPLFMRPIAQQFGTLTK